MTPSKFLIIQSFSILCIAAAILFNCADIYFMKNRVTDLENRVTTLEAVIYCGEN